MSEQLVLRPYQLDAVDRLRNAFRKGQRAPVCVAPTGAGKTAIAAHLMSEAKRLGTRTAFVVDRVNLVDQTSALLDRYGIDHGVIQAGHWRRRGYEPLQVCSVQTLEKRGFFPDLQLLIVDEAHCMRKQTVDLIKNTPRLKALGLTATPFAKGMGQVYDELVNVTTTNQLIADGFLVPLNVYAAVKPNMDGAKVVAGEWADSDIETRGREILGDIVSEWQSKTDQHFGGPVKTIVFAASVAHGAELCAAFNAQGYNFQQLSYRDSSDDARREIIEEFRKPDSLITGLISCEVLTKGFDVPDVLCGIGARPYRKSFSSHIQQLGRVMRPSPNKSFALWLDHGGNVVRFWDDHQDLFENGVSSLVEDSPDRKTRKDSKASKDEGRICCGKCKFILAPRATFCPACGHERKLRSLVETLPGAMVFIDGQPKPATGQRAFLADKNEVWQQLVYLGLERKGGDLDDARRFAQRQFKTIYGDFARRNIGSTTPMAITPELHGLVKHNLIKWARGRAFA